MDLFKVVHFIFIVVWTKRLLTYFWLIIQCQILHSDHRGHLDQIAQMRKNIYFPCWCSSYLSFKLFHKCRSYIVHIMQFSIKIKTSKGHKTSTFVQDITDIKSLITISKKSDRGQPVTCIILKCCNLKENQRLFTYYLIKYAPHNITKTHSKGCQFIFSLFTVKSKKYYICAWHMALGCDIFTRLSEC